MEHLIMIHNILTKAAENHPVGVLFVIGAIAAMAIQTGIMYRLLRPLSLLITIVVACYGVFAIYFSGSVGVFIIGMFCCGFGYWVGNYFTYSARKEWYPETVLKKYKDVPALPDLKTLTKEQLIKECVQLYKLATKQEKELKSDDDEDDDDDDPGSGISIKIG